MMSTRALLLATLLVATTVLAGCTSDLGPSHIESKDQFVPFAGEYHWSPDVVHDGAGNILLNHPLVDDPSAANYIYQLLPEAGPEPTLGVTRKGNALDPSRGSIFVVTLDQLQKSDDWGRTWEVVYEYQSANQPTTQDVYSTYDPLMYVDPDTDYIFVSHLEPDPSGGLLGLPWCQYLAYSKDNGKTWSDKLRPGGQGVGPGVQSCMVGISDHQKITTGKVGPKTDAATRALIENWPNKYPKVLYYCHQKFQLVGDPTFIYQDILTIPVVDQTKNPIWGTWCETSYDAGATWNHPVQIAPLRDGCPAGINGFPTAWPDGTVAVPLGNLGLSCGENPPTVVVSEDSGVTWTMRKMPDTKIGQVEIDPDIAVDAEGTAYMTFRGKDQHMYLVRSKDKFITWEGPWRVSPPDHTLNVFTAVVVGDPGRIAIHYLGTRDAQVREAIPSNATGGSFWHSYMTWSLNANEAEPTFYTQQATPEEDPIQIGCVWLSGGGGGPTRCRNLLDFVDAVADHEGRVIAVSTDGCTPRSGCTGDTDSVIFQSRDREAAILVQDSGYSLFKDKGVLPSLGLQEPRPLPRE